MFGFRVLGDVRCWASGETLATATSSPVRGAVARIRTCPKGLARKQCALWVCRLSACCFDRRDLLELAASGERRADHCLV